MTDSPGPSDPTLSPVRLRQAIDTVAAMCNEVHPYVTHRPCDECGSVIAGLELCAAGPQAPSTILAGTTGVQLPENSGYHILVTDVEMCRPFLITCALQEGYDQVGRIHTIDDVRVVVQDWMLARAVENRPYFALTISEADLTYAVPTDGGAECIFEPVAQIAGEVSVVYNPYMSDDEVTEILAELAVQLGKEFGQTRVYVRYREASGRDINFVIEADGRTSPRAS